MARCDDILPPAPSISDSDDLADNHMHTEVKSGVETMNPMKDVCADEQDDEAFTSRRKRMLLLACLCILGRCEGLNSRQYMQSDAASRFAACRGWRGRARASSVM